MAITKVTRTLLSTGIVDNSNATAITIDSSENVGIGRTPTAYGSFKVLDLAGSSGAIQKLIHTGSTVELQSYASSTVGAVGTATSHSLLFTTGDTERMRITAGGATRIVAGNSLELQNAAGNNEAVIRCDGAGTNTDLRFDTGGSERVRIDSSGNVGIGLTNPADYYSRSLVVSATAEQGITIAATGTSMSNYLMFADGTSGDQRYRGYIAYSHTNDRMAFASAGTEKMYIDTSGNVGIGIASPTSKLDVRGVFHVGASASTTPVIGRSLAPSGSQGMFITASVVNSESTTTPTFADNSSSGASIYLGGNAGDQYGGNVTLKAYGAAGTSTCNLITFENRSGTNTFTERMRIDSSGRLLVGTTSVLQADNKLTVSGSGTGAGSAIMDIRNTSSNDNCGVLSLSKTTTTTTSANRFIYFYTNNFGTGMGAIAGNGATNVQFVSASDERLKENIKPLTGSLDKVLALNPVSYTWKENGDHIKAGFIAQEVEKVLPEYTDTEDDEMKTKSITGGMTAGYIAVLTKAIQEQQTQIEALQSEINELKNS